MFGSSPLDEPHREGGLLAGSALLRRSCTASRLGPASDWTCGRSCSRCCISLCPDAGEDGRRDPVRRCTARQCERKGSPVVAARVDGMSGGTGGYDSPRWGMPLVGVVCSVSAFA
jgi:hypothetical protein